MSMNGWYKMHRKKIHSPDFIAKYAFDWMLFEWLIASVNWEDEPRKRTFGGREWMEQTGEIVASVRYIATALKATKSQTECGLKRLQNADRIRTRVVDGKSLIAVTNFKHYQDGGQNTGQNTDRTQTEHRTNIKKQEVRTKKQTSKASALDVCVTWTQFADVWNRLAGVRTIRKMTAKRTAALRKRMSETVVLDSGDELPWLDALVALSGAFPLRCFRAGDWIPSVEWILRPDTLQRIADGSYDWEKTTGAPGEVTFDAAKEVLREIEETGDIDYGALFGQGRTHTVVDADVRGIPDVQNERGNAQGLLGDHAANRNGSTSTGGKPDH